MTRQRLIGLVGGMSWESSAEYYRLANELVAERLGGLHSADLLLRSVEFAEIEELQRAGRDDERRRFPGTVGALDVTDADLRALQPDTGEPEAGRDAFDVTVQPTLVSMTKVSSTRSRFSMSYLIRNAKSEAVTVERE